LQRVVVVTASELSIRRRLLFLLPYAPRLDATHGGGRVTAQLLTQLAVRHSIALLYLRAATEPPLDDILRQRCDLVEEIARSDTGFSFARWTSLAASLLRGRPLWAAVTAVARFDTRVRAVAKNWQPDIVQLECHVMGQYISALNGCPAPRVLTEHEPGTKAARDLCDLSKGMTKVRLDLAARAWERFERSVIRQVHAIVVFTESDRQAIVPFASPQSRIVRIPLGTLVPDLPLSPIGRQPVSLLFVGNFVHPPNIDAALRLMTDIFPRLRSHFPGLILQIVGDRPTVEMRRMANDKMIVTGRVLDVTPYLDAAAVVVVPLRLGGGMRVKVLEALAAGKAVVASPLAVEGIEIASEAQVVLAESDEEFIDAISGLLTDPEECSSLASRARAWACVNLGWERSVAAYEELYDALLRARVTVSGSDGVCWGSS
jgi:glycosyltransferase involved in cell wall biosynthesis